MFEQEEFKDDFKIADKLPYRFKYKFLDVNGKLCDLSVIDWEIGALFWNCLKSYEDEKKALEKVPFVVSFSAYQDETSHMADLVLPDHTYLEKTDDIVWPMGLQYPLYGLTKPVVEPIYDTRSTGDVIIQLAKGVGQSTGSAFPWRRYEDLLKERATGLFDSGEGLVSYHDSNPAWKWHRSPRPDYSSFNDMWDKIKSGGLWYRPVRPSTNRERLLVA